RLRPRRLRLRRPRAARTSKRIDPGFVTLTTGSLRQADVPVTTGASTAAPAPAGDAAPPAATDWRALLPLPATPRRATPLRLLPLGIDPRAHAALAIGLFMIVSWMTQVLDHGIAGILGCFLFWMFGIAKFDTAFSGFADTTPWFLFGAICFGLMGSKSGLAR